MAARKSTKKKQHYVDNKKFLEAIIKYKEKVDIAEAKGLAKANGASPRMTEYRYRCNQKPNETPETDETKRIETKRNDRTEKK